MSVPLRPSAALREGYHSPQVAARVRLNTNESPYPPPPQWYSEVAARLAKVEFNRYPDRHAWALREALGELHGVAREEVFCANGSNEVLQSLMLAYGGHGRQALTFEPTYALHSHISRLVGTEVIQAGRSADFTIERGSLARFAPRAPEVVFLCSPNNPTGISDPPGVVGEALALFGGLVVLDEAYAPFAGATEPAAGHLEGRERLVVVRTFSKSWGLAGARLGYAIAAPEVVSAMEAACLPYHLDSFTQLAGIVALEQAEAAEAHIAELVSERARLQQGLGNLGLTYWPSDANFVLFASPAGEADALWEALLRRSVLVRNCSSWPGLEGCLRVTVGTPEENAAFLDALQQSLEELS